MKRKRHTEEQIIAILKKNEAGAPVPELARGGGAVHLPLAIEVWWHGSIWCQTPQTAGRGKSPA